MHLRQRAEQVKRGVLEAGGFPVEMPVATLSETFCKPTPMMYRNLLSMEAEELLRSYPADGAVLMGGCDKTTPALLMGAASAGIPAIYVTAGPMLRGNFRGQPLGSGTDMWKFWDDARAGLIGECELAELECGIARLAGPLHDDGHRLDYDLGRRGPRHDPARDGLDPRGRLGALPDGRGQRPAHRGHGLGGPHPGQDPHPRGVRGRGGHRARARRLHQRVHPPDRDGRPGRRATSRWTTSTPSRAASRGWRTSGRAGST